MKQLHCEDLKVLFDVHKARKRFLNLKEQADFFGISERQLMMLKNGQAEIEGSKNSEFIMSEIGIVFEKGRYKAARGKK